MTTQAQTTASGELLSQVKEKTRKSGELFEEAKKVIPGGVRNGISEPQPYPISLVRGEGSKVWDIDGNQYIDYWLGHGSLSLGHTPPEIVEAVVSQIQRGWMLDQHESELQLARKMTRIIPSAELVRFTVSGTEASLNAVRLARAFTGKQKIVKFEGAYHGAHDSVLFSLSPPLSNAGPHNHPNTYPESRGLPHGLIENTIIVPFNDEVSLEEVLSKNSDEICAVIVEPVQRANISPKPGFLKDLRRLTQENGILLIFDEVITGFRLALGGAQEFFGVVPDISIFAKGMGAGFPMGAFVGRREIMEMTDPARRKGGDFSFHAGTFGGNPVSCSAAIAAIGVFEKRGYYENLRKMTELLQKGLVDVVTDLGVSAKVFAIMGIWYVFFTDTDVKDYRSAITHSSEKFKELYFRMLLKGIHCNFPVRSFLSRSHTPEDIENTRQAFEESLRQIGH